MILYCDFDDPKWSIGGKDPNDSWSRDSYRGTYTITRVTTQPGMRDPIGTAYGEDIKPGDTVWVVYAEYTSEDTFGSDGGYGAPIAVTTSGETALQIADWASSVREFADAKELGEDWAQGMDHPPYPNWIGYFERLDDVRIFGPTTLRDD